MAHNESLQGHGGIAEAARGKDDGHEDSPEAIMARKRWQIDRLQSLNILLDICRRNGELRIDLLEDDQARSLVAALAGWGAAVAPSLSLQDGSALADLSTKMLLHETTERPTVGISGKLAVMSAVLGGNDPHSTPSLIMAPDFGAAAATLGDLTEAPGLDTAARRYE